MSNTNLVQFNTSIYSPALLIYKKARVYVSEIESEREKVRARARERLFVLFFVVYIAHRYIVFGQSFCA